MKTDENMVNLQLLFCKLQQKGKTGKKQSKQEGLMFFQMAVNNLRQSTFHPKIRGPSFIYLFFSKYHFCF